MLLLPKKTWIICRVCLKQHEGLHDIFEKISSFNIWLSLRDCGGVPVRKNDNLPDKICEQCLLHLWESYKFRLEVQRGHSEITHMLSERNYNIYEKELEEERKASSDILQPPESKQKIDSESPLKHEPKSNTNASPLLDQTKLLKTSDKTDITDKEFVTIKPDRRNSIMPEQIKTIEIANGPLKQYCIVKRKHLVKEEDKDKNKSLQNANRKRIILLLKLKNDTNVKTKLKADTSIKSVTKSVSEAIPKTKRRTISKIKHKSNKTKSCATQNKFTCKHCRKTYDTFQLLRHHSYTHDNPYQCKTCGKTFSQSQALLSHLNSHSGDRPFNCRICNISFSDQSNRNKHERTEHVEENKKFNCQQCSKKFRFLWMLEKHSNVHKTTKCSICDKVLASTRILRNHLQRIHMKIKNE